MELVKPSWLRIRPEASTNFDPIKQALRSRNLVTVCEEAHCPNMAECWHQAKTATFMVMGDTCTRGCKFCAVKKSSRGQPLDPLEPESIAAAAAEMGLDYVVITSVDRDDLPDQGANHFAACIAACKAHGLLVEVLTPDFRGDPDCIKIVADAKPDVFAHNIEQVERLQTIRDPRAGYLQSIGVLKTVKSIHPKIFTKSAIMVGLGETREEMLQAMKDLREADCDFLTIGQYLKPRNRFLKVHEYVKPETFDFYKEQGLALGFRYVASGPFVRSSYRAGELFVKSLLAKRTSG